MHCDIFQTPFGWVGIAATEQGVCRIVLPRNNWDAVEKELHRSARGAQRTEEATPAVSRIITESKKLLKKYFSGKGVSFDLVLDLRYYTAFQQKVWHAVATIPYGETRSYASIAAMIANPKAVRAVGQAMGANPVPLLIP